MIKNNAGSIYCLLRFLKRKGDFMSKVVVLGSGGWGIALALTAYDAGNEVYLWSLFQKEVDDLIKNREHKKLLPGVAISEGIKITNDLSVVEGADLTIAAVPSTAIRSIAGLLKGRNCGIIVNVAKGIENKTFLRLSEILADETGSCEIAVLSGPSHAEEVSRKIPTSVVSASVDPSIAGKVQELMTTDYFRIYTNDDVVGVELGGAIKNVIAVAAGIIDGLSLGDNTKAALITRGVYEMSRLGVAMGARRETFSGLSGLGDLIVTCTSEHSRNHRFGKLLGEGSSAKAALEAVGTVEGYYAAAAVKSLAEKYGVEMPICDQCYDVIYNGIDAVDALKKLMTRPNKNEHETLLK